MSTGAPSLSVDLTPLSNGHNHGHSRSRGHSRSNRWTQPPPPLSQPADTSLPEHPTPINAVNSSYSYGHKRQGSSHGHHAHSHSSAHHKHNHSVSSIQHDTLDHHDMKDPNGAYRTMSADINMQADYSPDKMYVC